MYEKEMRVFVSERYGMPLKPCQTKPELTRCLDVLVGTSDEEDNTKYVGRDRPTSPPLTSLQATFG